MECVVNLGSQRKRVVYLHILFISYCTNTTQQLHLLQFFTAGAQIVTNNKLQNLCSHFLPQLLQCMRCKTHSHINTLTWNMDKMSTSASQNKDSCTKRCTSFNYFLTNTATAVPCSRTFVPDVSVCVEQNWFVPVARPPHSWRLHWLLGQSCHCVHFVVAASFGGNVKLCVILVTMETCIVFSDVTMMLTYSMYSENNNVR